jgi:hypothetical protein
MTAVVLVSGGMDSCVTAAIAREENDTLAFLHISYGQRTENRERRAFNDIADFYVVKDRLDVSIEYLANIGGSSLTDPGIAVSEADLESKEIPTSYVPFRNANMLAIATSSGLATLHFQSPVLRESAGGILGRIVGQGLEYGLGLLGTTVLLLVLWLAAVQLATGVSWIAIMDRTGRVVYQGITALNAWIGDARLWWEGRRAKLQRDEVVSKVRSKSKTT